MKKVCEPQQARAHKTRSRILHTARRRFANQGFRGTRVDDIANEARVNKERIYAYFGGKHNLFVAVLRDVFEEMARADESLLEIPESELGTLQERLMHHYVRFHSDHPHFRQLLAWENLEGGRHTEALHEIREPSFHRLRLLYEKGQQLGHFRKEVGFEAWVLVIISISYFYFANMKTMSKTLGLDLGNDATRERLVNEMLKLLN
jgi:TetR/AcrR family transcriptional regulator